MNVDPLAEQMSEWSPYNYVLGNPVRLVDPDGKGPGDTIGGFIVGLVDNVAGTNIRSDYGGTDFENGTKLADVVSVIGGVILEAKGLADITTGTAGLESSVAVTAGTGGLAVEVTAPAAAASGALIGFGAIEVVAGKNIFSNAMSNLKNGNSSSSSSSSKTIKEQASDLKKSNGDKNSVTVKTSNGQTRYDLEGKAHAGVETPHKQTYKNNVVEGKVKSVTRTSKNAEPMNQQDIRNVRKVLGKR